MNGDLDMQGYGAVCPLGLPLDVSLDLLSVFLDSLDWEVSTQTSDFCCIVVS